MSLLREESAQVSAELIIVIAAVLAVAVILVKQLRDTAQDGSKKMSEKSKKVLSEIDKIK
ncbi:hypothetical protein K8R43_01120 [archaeon]|nr:hypothetical protein [archaeon]